MLEFFERLKVPDTFFWAKPFNIHFPALPASLQRNVEYSILNTECRSQRVTYARMDPGGTESCVCALAKMGACRLALWGHRATQPAHALWHGHLRGRRHRAAGL